MGTGTRSQTAKRTRSSSKTKRAGHPPPPKKLRNRRIREDEEEDEDFDAADPTEEPQVGADNGQDHKKLIARIKELEQAKEHHNPKKNTKMCNLIKSAVRKFVFRKYKFIDKVEMETDAVEYCHHYGQFGKLISLGAFKDKYTKQVMKEINGARQYVQSNLRKAVFAYMDKKGLEEVPSLDLIVGCVERKKPDGVTETEFQDFFDFYVRALLPIGCANKEDWSPNTRSNMCISELMCPSTQKPQITPSTEAFIALVWENCQLCWNVQYHFISKYHPDKCPQAQQFTEDEMINLPTDLKGFKEAMEDESEEDARGLIPPNKYSNAFKGQHIWGGWSKAGKKQLPVYRDANKAARGSEYSNTLEKNACMALAAKASTKNKGSKSDESDEEPPEEYGLIDDDE